MKSIYAKHEPYWSTGHLGDVVEEMKTQGSPTIRVSDFKGKLCALEGSHRLASAYHLGIIPKIVIQEEETDLTTTEFWDKVVSTLPEYEFEHVLVLDLRNFTEN